jgi:DNA-binding MarR family transcriptional regulator
MQAIINNHENEALAQNIIAARRTMWRETMLGIIASTSNFDIPAIQFATLFLLGVEGELTIKQVAEALGRSVSTASRLLDQLVVRGLVCRNEDERDRRTKRVSLSEKGRAFVHTVERMRVEAQIAMMAYLSPEERTVVEQAMQFLAVAARRQAEDHARSNISSTNTTTG